MSHRAPYTGMLAKVRAGELDAMKALELLDKYFELVDNPKNTSRRVITPDGVFSSVRAAARHYGIWPNSAYYRAARRTQGWRFADE